MAAVQLESVKRFVRGKIRWGDSLIRVFCLVCAVLSIVVTVGIVVVLLRQAAFFFREVPLAEFFGGIEWAPTAPEAKFGVWPLITGTLMITVGAGLFAIPLGMLAGLFLSEYAPPWVRRILKPALELLAGIPTVVYGYFGLYFVTPILQRFFPETSLFNAASGAIVVGIMTLPLVSSLCEDAMNAVPRSLREGAYALGATKLEVSMKIVVPAALSGIVASFILALSRAIGETMAVTLAAGANPNFTLNPLDAVQTMTAYIVNVSKGDLVVGTVSYNTIFAVGITLFAITLTMNMVAQVVVRKFRRQYA